MVDIDVINQYEDREKAETGEVVLNGVSIPTDAITTSYTSRFESKITLGDYTKDSDQLLSTWIQSNWVGGVLVNEHIEGATEQRGRWGKAWTMSAEQLALPPKHDTMDFGAEILPEHSDVRGPVSMPLIEIGGVLYVAMGKEVWRVMADDGYGEGFYGTGYYGYGSESTGTDDYQNLTYSKIGDLPGLAQEGAVAFNDQQTFAIPLGKNGVVFVNSHYHPTTPETVGTHDATIKAISLCEWDNKVFAFTDDRYLRVYHPPDDQWDAESEQMRVSHGEIPRGLELFYGNSGDQAVFLITNRRLWAFDYEVGKIYPSTLPLPKHHNNGLGFTNWRDDGLYISSGTGVTRYTRDGVNTAVGLDRDDGIPPELLRAPWGRRDLPFRPSRSITSMAGTHNFIAAAVQMGHTEDDSNRYGHYAIVVWNEGGWHVLCEDARASDVSTGAVTYPVGLYVTESVGGYRLWWGEGAAETVGGSLDTAAYNGVPRLHSMPLPRSSHGPRQKVLDNIDEFAPTGYFETGWMDAGMRGFEKTWSHLEVFLTDPGNGIPPSGSVEVLYRTDANPNVWLLLGTVENYGRNVLTFGEDDKGFPRGHTSNAIEFRFNLSTPETFQSPIINSYILKFIKLALPGRSWMVSSTIATEDHRGIGPKEMSEIVARQTWQGGFSHLIDGTDHFRVRVSQVQHFGGTGEGLTRSIGLNIIEVPIPGHQVWGGE